MPLTKNRNTIMREAALIAIPVAAGARIFQGALVATQAAGFATPGATSATLKGQGRAEEEADNTGGTAGAISVTVRRGVFQFKNLAGDPVAQADLGNDCFIVDDETVARTNGGNTRSVAGKVRGVETGGVWVEF